MAELGSMLLNPSKYNGDDWRLCLGFLFREVNIIGKQAYYFPIEDTLLM